MFEIDRPQAEIRKQREDINKNLAAAVSKYSNTKAKAEEALKKARDEFTVKDANLKGRCTHPSKISGLACPDCGFFEGTPEID